jgi:hypothetical protein
MGRLHAGSVVGLDFAAKNPELIKGEQANQPMLMPLSPVMPIGYKTTDKPILLLKLLSGALIKTPQINWLESNVENLTSKWIGQGIHYVQESHPKAIAKAISQWQLRL